jgi:hypothetical protein
MKTNLTIKERRELNKKWYHEQMASKEENNAKLFTKEARYKCGRFCKEFDKYGFVCGITLGDDDFYWLIINEDRTISYSSGVGNPKYYDSDELPASLYVLNYLLDNQPEEIINIIKKSLQRNSDYLFTKIYLKNKSYDIFNIRGFKKSNKGNKTKKP